MNNIVKAIKKESKLALTNSWGKALMATFCFTLPIIFIFIVADILSFVLNLNSVEGNALPPIYNLIYFGVVAFFIIIFLLFVYPTLYLGTLKFYYNSAKGVKDSFFNIFEYFKKGKYINSIKFAFPKVLKSVAIISIILLLVVNSYLWLTYFENVFLDLLGTIVSVFFASFLIIIFFKIMYKSAIIEPVLYFENEEKMINYKLQATQIQKENKKAISKLLFSFYFWIALCYFVMPIFFVIPYLNQAVTVNTKWLVQLQKQKQEAFSNTEQSFNGTIVE